MVIKPSPYVPLIDLLIAEAIEECDLPPGVFNVVTGDGPELGAALVESPLVDKISFTGSAVTGKRIMAAAAPTLKRVHLELGGKSAAIVLDDADLDQVVPYASSPAFFHAGQGCAMCTRVLVPAASRTRSGRAPRHASSATSSSIGDPGRSVGHARPGDPRGAARRRSRSTSPSGKREGARLATGGGRPTDKPRGYFLQPTVFADVRNDMRIAREEIFGPVLSVLPFDDVDEAVRIANDSPYGLGGAHLRDRHRQGPRGRQAHPHRHAQHQRRPQPRATCPFGGFKESGIGREGGRWGLDEYTEIQSITWR